MPKHFRLYQFALSLLQPFSFDNTFPKMLSDNLGAIFGILPPFTQSTVFLRDNGMADRRKLRATADAIVNGTNLRTWSR
jgi:hypothetical protein